MLKKIPTSLFKKCLFFGSFLFFSNVFGVTIYVNDADLTGDTQCTAIGAIGNDGLSLGTPKLSLSAALSIANNGDIIFVETGTYSGVNNRSLAINKQVQILGAGESLTVFDNLLGVQSWGIISANNVKISKLTITRYALASDGIAISITTGTGIELNRVLIYANVGSAGQGAVFISGASTSVTIRNSGSPCNRIASANYGGGYKIDGATVLFDNCSINNNVVTSFNGGGVRVEGATANVTINKCTFDDNSSQAGGGMCIVAGTVNINNSCFTGNKAEGNSNVDGGGAIFIQPGATTNVNISNCSFLNNQATNGSADGGAISVKNTSSAICNINFTTCSFTTNSCSDKGEDVYFDLSFSPTYNVIFKNNTFFTVYSGTQVNIYNQDFPAASIKFEGLVTPTGASANGDIVIDGLGVSIDKPEMGGVYNESSVSLPSSLPLTTCIDRFDGSCGTTTATFACITQNIWNGSEWSRGTNPTIFEHVVLNANYNTLTHGNINACQMTIKTGVVLDVVDGTNGTYVYVVNSIFNNGTINVASKANLVQVNYPNDLNNEAIVTPTINFTKNTGNKIRWDYIYWSKPISNSVLTSYNSSFDLKYYWDPDYCINGVNFSYQGWRPLISEPAIGTGFITRVKTSLGIVPTNISLSYSGVSNNGDYTATVKYYDAEHNAFRNFTLLGNPYPGAIKFEDFYRDNSDKIYGTVYFWSSNTPYPGSGLYIQADYATFNLTGGVGIPGASSQSPNGLLPNGYIASAQGFMVRPKVNSTVLFKNSHRTKDVPSNNQFYKTSQEESKDRYWLRLTDEAGRYNELLIGHIQEATNGFDEAYDGPINSLSSVKFYSVLENEKLVIQGRSTFIDSDTIDLNYELINASNMLTIGLTNKEGIFETQKIYLHDKKYGFYHDLTQSDYFFYQEVFENRFEIIYKLKTATEQVLDVDTTIQAVILNGNLNVISNVNLLQIELYDVNGKLIISKINNQDTNNFNQYISLSSGVYVVNVTCVNGEKKSIKILNQ